MPPMLEPTLGGAFAAGLLSFLSPCILPMVPFYLSYMAGLSVAELRGGALPPRVQGRLVGAALAFAAGVLTIFVALGLGATALGGLLRDWLPVLSWVAAAVLALFGLHFLGVLRIPLFYREARLETEARPTTIPGAYLTGLAFAFGWTPCVGPALAMILALAAGQETLGQGAALLVAYGVGMTAPFVVAALFAAPFLGWLARHRGLMAHVEKAMGVMLIVFAVLIATGGVSWLADLLLRSFDWDAVLR